MGYDKNNCSSNNDRDKDFVIMECILFLLCFWDGS